MEGVLGGGRASGRAAYPRKAFSGDQRGPLRIRSVRAHPGTFSLLLLALAVAGSWNAKALFASEGAEEYLLGPTDPRTILAISPEWQAIYDSYAPDPVAFARLSEMAQAGSGFKVEVLLGSWCGDSRRQVPKFLKIEDLLGDHPLPATYVGVHKQRELRGDSVKGKDIQGIPSFIVYRDGKEIGRITEIPKDSMEGDLASILSGESQTEGGLK